MKSRRRRLLIVVLTLVFYVSMQSLVLAHSAGCTTGGRVAASASPNVTPAQPHCHHQSAMGTHDPACAAHCHNGEVTQAKTVPPGVPPCAIPRAFASVVIGASIATSLQHSIDARSEDPGAPPRDLAVLHCSLLI